MHFDVFLPGIASQTWDDTAIFNAFATSSDDTLWGLPTNVIFNSELELSSLFFTSSSPGRVNWTYVDTPLTMLTDFVMSFDITAIAAGAGLFSANGADIFQASDQEDTFFTNSDSVDFNIVAEVPISNSLALIGVGLLCSVVSRRHLIT
ncbi:MAG: hypothetical protein K0U41_05100 [Gammaproteobacteria bacterium]|nr:hypothetical protein [Gammaproteobacteria bacterium]